MIGQLKGKSCRRIVSKVVGRFFLLRRSQRADLDAGGRPKVLALRNFLKEFGVFADPKEGEKRWLDIPSPQPAM